MTRNSSSILVVFGGALAVLAYVLLSREAVSPGQRDAALTAAVLGAYRPGQEAAPLEILYPLDETVFPPEIIAPTFRWKDPQPRADTWLVSIAFQDGHEGLTSLTTDRRWRPSAEQWDAIKRRTLETLATAMVIGVKRAAPTAILSAGRIRIRTSKDEVGAPLFYREVNLPFIEAVKDPSKIRWRFGRIGSEEQPPVVLTGLPVCGNCHSFSANGRTLGMDVDYANDKGSYVIAPVSEETVLDRSRIITWSDYRRKDGEPTFGLLSQLSPSGEYAVCTVKDRSVFVPRPDLAFSQLFFPIKGILAVYCRRTGSFEALPGADDKEFVQSNPAWSPDGKHIAFARAKAATLNVTHNEVLLTPEECREFTSGEKSFLFDLYRIPFNDGKGGKAEPIEGASHNGLSNYFPKYSPDGRWIVFCRAKSFMLLQPDSQLFIIPAEGGVARRMRCNTPRMNSWHSWSPNGRWLVFSAKPNGPYTQLFLAHIDPDGESSPPVLLERFTAADRAANIPEFVNLPPDAIRAIRGEFVDDHSFARGGDRFAETGDKPAAVRAYREALRLNPRSAYAHARLASVLAEQRLVAEAHEHAVKALEYGPNEPAVHVVMGAVLFIQGRHQEAMAQYREALRIDPGDTWAHMYLGVALVTDGDTVNGMAELSEAIRVDPRNVGARFELGRALTVQGNLEAAAAEYRRALNCNPKYVPALVALATIRAAANDPRLRQGQEAVALALEACRLTGHKEPVPLDILAAAYAEAGRFPEAVQAASKALRLAEDRRDDALASRTRARMELYRRSERIPTGDAQSSLVEKNVRRPK